MAESKEKRVAKEQKRLLNLYKNIAKNKLELVSPLIQNAAFMAVTLEDLQSVINESGTCEEYIHGANQHGRKSSAEIQTYNSMMKNYQTCIMALDKMLPAEAAKSKLQRFAEE